MNFPKTIKSIRENFPGKNNAGIRKELRDSLGGELPSRRFALTARGKASFDAVSQVYNDERS